MRPWFKKKRIMIPLVLTAIIGVVTVANAGGDDEGKVTSAGSSGQSSNASDNPNRSEADIFPNRPDEKDGDKERNIGQAADLSGYTVTVTAAGGQQQINEFQRDGYLVAQVTLLNRDKAAQAYNLFDWKLITPSGTIIDPCFGCGDQLGSGDLVQNGTISGQLVFETQNTPGDYYVIYDPDFASDNRGVWKVTV